MQYPAVGSLHTNYKVIISHCTTLQYNHYYLTQYLVTHGNLKLPLACGIFIILSSSSDIEGCRAVVSGIIWIRLHSSHVGVSRCLRLIRYSFENEVVLRNVSSACLNDSDEQLVIFRTSDGQVLKSMGPRTAKLSYRIV